MILLKVAQNCSKFFLISLLIVTSIIITHKIFAQETVTSFYDDFGKDRNWTVAEEIVGGNPCYGDNLAQIGSSTDVFYQGKKSFKVTANQSLSSKSNHVIAVQRLSPKGQNGKYKYEVYAYIDPVTAQTGQTGPEFSIQNTRKFDNLFLTTTGGIQYRLNPWDKPTNMWAVWIKKPDGKAGWTTFLHQPLEPGKWYYLSMSMDFDTNTYDRFVLKGNGIDIDIKMSQYLIAKEAKWNEEVFDITLESENLWNNCGKDGNFRFNVYYDNARLTSLSVTPTTPISTTIIIKPSPSLTPTISLSPTKPLQPTQGPFPLTNFTAGINFVSWPSNWSNNFSFTSLPEYCLYVSVYNNSYFLPFERNSSNKFSAGGKYFIYCTKATK